jgi:hypothetical protein
VITEGVIAELKAALMMTSPSPKKVRAISKSLIPAFARWGTSTGFNLTTTPSASHAQRALGLETLSPDPDLRL